MTTDSSHRYTVAPHLLNRDFYRQAPGVACVSGITYVQTLEGFLYLMVVLDLFDRKPIGWSISDGMSASKTVILAILMASRSRSFKKGMIFHSDRGVQYASTNTVNVLKSFGI